KFLPSGLEGDEIKYQYSINISLISETKTSVRILPTIHVNVQGVWQEVTWTRAFQDDLFREINKLLF
ncbi:hypothetical protein ACFL27_24730, partial [candidate division CSSED10-310 bacterium]